MTIRRTQFWEHSLAAYFDRVCDNKFKFGVFDCTLFAAGAVEAMTGVDLAAEFRDQYSDARSAAELLRNQCEGTLEKTVTALLGEPKHVAQAKRGDVVFYEGSLGICCGRYSRFVGAVDTLTGQTFPVDQDYDDTPAGLILISTHLCDHAWTVAF